MQDAEENVRGSEVVKTEHISVIEDALFFVYKANSFEYPLHSGRIGLRFRFQGHCLR